MLYAICYVLPELPTVPNDAKQPTVPNDAKQPTVPNDAKLPLVEICAG